MIHRCLRALPAALLVCACTGNTDDRPSFHPGRAAYDTARIDLTGFVDDPVLQMRVLRMSFGEAAARLGSLRFDAVSTFEFNRGGESLEQHDSTLAVQDVDGNFHLRLQTPTNDVEYYLVGEDVFVRHDLGPLRQKPRREVETEASCDIAFSSIYQTLDLFRPRLAFTNATPTEIIGRPAIRFKVELLREAAGGDQPQPVAVPFPPSRLPLSPPPQVAELLARPLDLTGKIWVDRQTGVVLKSEVRGRLEIPDRDVRPTQLTLSYGASITQIAAVTEIPVPKSIPEYRREPPPRDLVEFFRDQLPAPPPEATPGGPPGPGSAPAPAPRLDPDEDGDEPEEG